MLTAMRRFSSDIRYALRTLTHGATAIVAAVLSLAVGVGANAAIFSIGYAMLVHPLPYAGADRLVMLRSINPSHSDAKLLGKVLDVNIINLSRVGPTPSFVAGIASSDMHFLPLSGDSDLGVSGIGIGDSVDFCVPDQLPFTSLLSILAATASSGLCPWFFQQSISRPGHSRGPQE